jgi:hypothetical protein
MLPSFSLSPVIFKIAAAAHELPCVLIHCPSRLVPCFTFACPLPPLQAEQLLDAVRQTEVPHDMLGPLARDLLEQGKAASDMKETPGDAIAPDLPRMRSGIIAAALLDSGVKPATTAAQDGGGGDVPEGEAEAAETETAWPGVHACHTRAGRVREVSRQV